MTSIHYDFGYFQAGVDLLEEYLLSPQIYWTLGARPPAGEPVYPQLTLGGLLLTQIKLNAHSLPVDLQAEVIKLEHQMERTLTHKRVAWEHKASVEYRSRLKLWGDFLDEYRKEPANHRDRYSYEVSRRVMLQLLDPYAREIHPAEREMCHGLDEILHAVLIPGGFIWDEEIARGFPKESYWYLYGVLKI